MSTKNDTSYSSSSSIVVPIQPYNTNATAACHPRVVVFIGPPKSATSSMERFFAKTMQPHRQIPSFSNWSYPLFLGKYNGLKELRHGPNKNPKTFQKLKKQLQHEYKQGYNLLVGSEYFISWETNHALDIIQNWTQCSNIEIVVNYRTPRLAHWLSIWKQSTTVRGKTESYQQSFHQWMCSNDHAMLWTSKLARLSHPLGIVQRLLDHGYTTYLIDMGGITRRGLDISHVVACHVLQVPCTNDSSWIQGVSPTVTPYKNQRHRDPNLTEHQSIAIERFFRQRDCAYHRQSWNDHVRLNLVYNDSLWDNCHEEDHPSTIYQDLQNVTILLHHLRQVVKCSGYENDSTIHLSSVGSSRSNNDTIVMESTSWYPTSLPTTMMVVPGERWYAMLQWCGLSMLLGYWVWRRSYLQRPSKRIPLS